MRPSLTYFPPIPNARHAGGTKETKFCTSTLPSRFGDVVFCNSTALETPPPPPLAEGQLGFTAEVWGTGGLAALSPRTRRP